MHVYAGVNKALAMEVCGRVSADESQFNWLNCCMEETPVKLEGWDTSKLACLGWKAVANDGRSLMFLPLVMHAKRVTGLGLG